MKLNTDRKRRAIRRQNITPGADDLQLADRDLPCPAALQMTGGRIRLQRIMRILIQLIFSCRSRCRKHRLQRKLSRSQICRYRTQRNCSGLQGAGNYCQQLTAEQAAAYTLVRVIVGAVPVIQTDQSSGTLHTEVNAVIGIRYRPSLLIQSADRYEDKVRTVCCN